MDTEEPTCWIPKEADSLIVCPKCGPITHTRNVWDGEGPYRFECCKCGHTGTVRFNPMRFEFDPIKLIVKEK